MAVTRRGSWRSLAPRRIVNASWLGGLVALSAVTLAACGAPSFPTGSGTATFTWHSIGSPTTSNAPQPYTGAIAGIPVQGTALAPPPLKPGGPIAVPARLEVARWTGTFEGRTFALAVTLLTSGLATTATVDVDGRFGSQQVRFVVGPEPVSSTTVHFHGTVGPHHVTGSVRPSQGRGARNRATATFTVAN